MPELLQQHSIPYIGSGMKKTEINQLAKLAVDSVLEDGNVLSVAEALAAMENFMKAVKADPRYIDYVCEELNKNKGKITTPSGAKIEVAEVGTKYDFTQCNDPEYSSLLEVEKDLKVKMKARETFLKTVPQKGMDILNEDEVVTIYRPSKTSTSSFKVTLKN